MKIIKAGEPITVDCSSCKATLEIVPSDLIIRWKYNPGEQDSPCVRIQCPKCENIISVNAKVFPETQSKLIEKAKSENRK